ncbi:MAG: lysine exporter LysO family protein, partial [Leptospirales bacterium]|nr:lysine exporter LysO family protein [Leptospirales bacterium]
MKGSLIILLFFLIGLTTGLFGGTLGFENIDNLSLYALYMLMFFVGIGVGADQRVWDALKKINVKIIIVPVIVIAGTILGTFICSFFLTDITVLDAMAIGSGFGYYSLSSILISKLRNESLGVMAL